MEQAISTAEAFESYSTSVIFQLTGNNVTPLGVGEPCDFIVLDRNPFDVRAEQLRDLKVLTTYKSGKKIA